MKPEEIQSSLDSSANDTSSIMSKVDELMWMDANDSLGTTMSLAAKDLDNLVEGVRTYGFSEALVYYETVLWDLWQFFSETQGMGMGFGIIMASLASRAFFAPIIIYS